MPPIWTRRDALRGLSGAAMAAAVRGLAQSGHVGGVGVPVPPDVTIDAQSLTPFVDALPMPERLQPVGANRYCIAMRPCVSRLHRDVPLTRVWSYGAGAAPPLIEARKGKALSVEWVNALPAVPLISHDGFMVMDDHAGDAPNRTVTHLHGAHVSRENDGYPEDWFAPGRSRVCHYANVQDATALWFHDHAMGVNRFNIYAGLMGMYLLRDEVEDALELPRGRYELPLMLYDRTLTKTGQLYYPNMAMTGDDEDEFYGDAMVVNGKIQPCCEVEARRYRLRLFNTANARVFPLRFKNEMPFQMIGSDQGLLAAPVATTRFDLAPGERADVMVDFSECRGEKVELQGDGFALIQFRVAREKVTSNPALPARLREVARIDEKSAVQTRFMTLAEYGDDMVMLLNGKHWHEPVTEIVKAGSTEIWELANLTDDMHPIHLHTVRFQVLDRQWMNVPKYFAEKRVEFTGPVMPPLAWEMGWKDVVQCPPRTLTRIVIPFLAKPGMYVWHCHVLEHEANDMMRPFEVVA